MRAAIALLVLMMATTASAGDYERILIPLFEPVPQPGAFGSQWMTELVVRNISTSEVAVLPPFCSAPVPPRFCRYEPVHFPSGRSVRLHGYSPRSGPVNLTIVRGSADDLAVNLRVRDVSRGSDQQGTAISIVRERDLATDRMHFLDVPAGDAFRPMIRIYDFDARQSARFVVRIHDFRSDDLISEQSVVTIGHAHTLPPGEPIDRPGYVQLSVDAPAEPVRIEIESLDGARFWAMVSVTSNETQLITLVLPQ